MSSKTSKNYSLIVVYFLATITLILIAVAIEVFFFRRNRAVRDISKMVGEHLNSLRNMESVGGRIPPEMLSNAMNQTIHETDANQANEAMKSMLELASESKRRSFSLPLVNKDIAITIKNWADKGDGEVAANAAKLFTLIAKRYSDHMDQLMAQTFVVISKTDSNAAVQAMKSLAYIIEGSITCGASIDAKILLSKENLETVQSWLVSQDESAKLTAELLMKTIDDVSKDF